MSKLIQGHVDRIQYLALQKFVRGLIGPSSVLQTHNPDLEGLPLDHDICPIMETVTPEQGLNHVDRSLKTVVRRD